MLDIDFELCVRAKSVSDTAEQAIYWRVAGLLYCCRLPTPPRGQAVQIARTVGVLLRRRLSGGRGKACGWQTGKRWMVVVLEPRAVTGE